VGVEEVAHRRYDLVAERGVEVAEKHRQVAPADLPVELRHREAVVAARVPARDAKVVELVEQVGIETAGVGLPGIGAVEQVDPRSPVPGIGINVETPLADEIELVHHRLEVAVLQADGAVEVAALRVAADPAVHPAVD